MDVFKRKLGDRVDVRMSGEVGEIRGRAEYLDNNPQYYISYTAGDGCQRQAWFYESDLVPLVDFSDDIPC